MTCQCIGSHREQFGVESVCRVLITSGLHAARSGCYTARNRSSCARAVSDAVVDERLRVLRRQSFNAALGSRRAWRLLTHPGGPALVVARCTVERRMRALGMVGIGTHHSSGGVLAPP